MDGESEKDRDTRIEKLWSTLDVRKEGQIDINGLKRGLKKMDHRLLTSQPYPEIVADLSPSTKKRGFSPP